MIDLKGKWVLVTGSSRGIGRLLAEALAKKGANLILHSRKIEHTDEIASLARSLGVSVRQVEADLSDGNSVIAMLDSIADLDVSVVYNNAGYQVTYRPDIYDTPYEDYDLSFRINTVAPMLICYRLFPLMKKNKFGRIVNTTSGIAGDPHQGPYSAAKAALDKVTADLATQIEADEDIVISLTDPGWCRTDLGGPSAPNAPESAVAGCLAPGFVSKCKSGRIIHAQEYTGLTFDRIVEELEQEI